ncbi:MAG: NAD(P)-dependent alcohol dehydrogenase [Acidimicrobiia bacterium]|nr:NAD(P)-dependent alcohol dehydrogenase [Acidimicrobiia bacterium]
MRAITRSNYGPPSALLLEDVPTPTPEDDEVLVRVHASSVNMADVDYLRGRPFLARMGTGPRRPRTSRLGLDVAGRVEAVGPGATRFQPGDDVFGDMTSYGFGAFADYVCVPEKAFAPKPVGISMEEAATVPQAGVMALQGLRFGRDIQPGDQVLINGAGGTVGPFAVLIAKALGAEVTGVDHTDKLDFVSGLGADHVVDYTQESYKKHRGRYHHILDVAPGSYLRARRALRPGGAYIVIPANVRQAFRAGVFGRLMSIGGKKVGMMPWRPGKAEDMAFLSDRLESGRLKPAIDRTYSLEEVPEALQRQDDGLARGKLVIVM